MSTSRTSFCQRVSGWVPSLPSGTAVISGCKKVYQALPSKSAVVSSCKSAYQALPSGRAAISSCTQAFQSLKNRFCSPAKPLNEKTIVVLDKAHKVAPKDSSQRRVMFKLAFGVGLAACFRFASGSAQVELFALTARVGASYATTLINSKLAPLAARAIFGATVFSLIKPTRASVPCQFSGWEGSQLSQSYGNWDISPAEFGRVQFTVDPALLAPGTELVPNSIRLYPNAAITGVNAVGMYSNVLYMSSITTGAVQSFNADPNNPYLAFTFNEPAIIHSIATSSDRVYMTGVGTIISEYDPLTNPRQPTFINRNLNSTRTGISNVNCGPRQSATLTTDGFFYTTGTQVTGYIPGISGIAGVTPKMAYSDEFLFVPTPTTLYKLSKTPSSTAISSISIPNITGLTYIDGYLYVGTQGGQFKIIDSNTMTEISSQPQGIIVSMLQVGDRVYFTTTAVGINVMGVANRTNPVFHPSAAGMLSQVGSQGKLMLVGNSALGIRTGLGYNFATLQDGITFQGIPRADSEGTYQFPLQSTTGATYPCTATIKNPITVGTTIPDKVSVVGQVFNEILSSSAFNHARGETMTYTLNCQGTLLTGKISFIPKTPQMTGTPPTTGTTTCTVKATDDFGSTKTSAPFKWSVVDKPTFNTPTNQVTPFGETSSIDLKTFLGNSNVEITNVSGYPSSFSLDENQWILSATPTTDRSSGSYTLPGSYPISVTVQDKTDGAQTVYTFPIKVGDPGAPTQVKPILLPDAVTTFLPGGGDSYTIAEGTFVNLDNPNTPIKISMISAASWQELNGVTLNWDPGYGDKFFGDFPVTVVLKVAQTLQNKEERLITVYLSQTLKGTGWGQVGLWTISFVTGLGILYRVRKVIYKYTCVKFPKCMKCCNAIRSIFEKCFESCANRCSDKCCCGKCNCSKRFTKLSESCGPLAYDEDTIPQLLEADKPFEFTLSTDASGNKTKYHFSKDGKEYTPLFGGGKPSFVKEEPTLDGKMKISIKRIPAAWNNYNFMKVSAKGKSGNIQEIRLFQIHRGEPKAAAATAAAHTAISVSSETQMASLSNEAKDAV